MRLNGVRALVTGGGSGLGLAVVERFLAEGARVVVLDKSADRVAALAARNTTELRGVVGDVTSFDDNERAVRVALDDFGGLDVFVGNAGVWDFGVPLVNIPADKLSDAFDELMAVNVKGYLIGAKAALEALVASRGSIILTLSQAAFFADGGGPLYTASKHAALGIVRQLAFELAPHVRVNGVAPGAIPTDLRGIATLDQADRSIDAVPLDRIMQDALPIEGVTSPETYAASYVFLAAKAESGSATGSVLQVHGGFDVRGLGRARGGDRLPEKFQR